MCVLHPSPLLSEQGTSQGQEKGHQTDTFPPQHGCSGQMPRSLILGRQRSFQRGDQRAEIILPWEELQCEPARMLVPRPLIVWLRLLNFPLSLECRFGHQGMETHSFMRLQGIGRKHETHSYKGGKQTSHLPSAMFMTASLLVLQPWLARLKGNAGGFRSSSYSWCLGWLQSDPRSKAPHGLVSHVTSLIPYVLVRRSSQVVRPVWDTRGCQNRRRRSWDVSEPWEKLRECFSFLFRQGLTK